MTQTKYRVTHNGVVWYTDDADTAELASERGATVNARIQ